MAKTSGYFTRISNDFIRSKKDDIDKRLLLIMIYLDRRRSFEDYVGFSLSNMIKECGYIPSRNNDSIFDCFKRQIEFLIDNQMIELVSHKSDLKGNNYACVKINNTFDHADNFTIITAKEIGTLLSSKSKIEKANLFAVYLYIKSYMFLRNTDYEADEDKPSAFWKTIDNVSFDLGISRETINRCINEILKLKLLVRHETGSYKIIENGKQVDKNAPNIYVLNNENAEQEIEWAVNKLKEIYKVDSFGEFKRRRSKIDNNKK